MLKDLFDQTMRRILAAAGTPGLIVSALSGGMDSIVLLHLLSKWRHNLPAGVKLIAAHLNHGIREVDANLDQELCRFFAASVGVELAERRVDVPTAASELRLGLEETGRLLRYRFFGELAADLSEGKALVLTGHHADDQAETILLHLRRGAHRRGLSGMREYSLLPVPPDTLLPVGRPLLEAGREKIRAYAFAHHLKWREDATNQDSSYARNRIRHRIIPALENLMPGFRDRLLAKARFLAREEEELSRSGRELAERAARRENGGRFFLLDDSARQSTERLIYAFRHVVEEEMGARLPYGAVLSSLAELAETGRLGETLSLPGRLLVRREHDGLFFFFPDKLAESAFEPTEFILPDPPFDIHAGGLRIRAEWLPTGGMPPPADMADPEVEWLNPANIRWPLRLRPPRPGERFRPIGSPGSRRIQDILVDTKTPRRKRGMPRVLADYAGGLWLWPYRLSNRVRLTGTAAKALRVSIREEEKGEGES